MDREFRHISWNEILAGAAVMVFIWAALWMVHEGVIVAYENIKPASNLAAVGAIPTPATTSSTSSATSSSVTATSTEITVMIAGDIMFDRRIRWLGETYGYDSLFASATPLLHSADIVIANLEGPVTDNASHTYVNGLFTKSFTFTFDPAAIPSLARAGFTAVSLANNHTANFGPDGVEKTQSVLGASGIGWFGDPDNATGTEYVIERSGIRVAFVGYDAFKPGFNNIIADVRRLSEEGDFVIVMPHWGTEYASTSDATMKEQALELAQAGAGAVIGSHPHVIMDHGWIGAAPVFYSLGNFLFDQYFSPAVMHGNVVVLHILKQAGGTVVDHVDVYNTSLASRRGVEIDPAFTRIDKP